MDTMDDRPSWFDLMETKGEELINALELPYGEGKEADIRKALKTQIQVLGLLETFVKIGVEIGEASAQQAAKAEQWLPIESSPKDGTRFLGAFYWPSKDALRRLEKVGGPAENVTYHYAITTYFHDGKWHVQNHAEVIDQDSIYMWQPIKLPPPPSDYKQLGSGE